MGVKSLVQGLNAAATAGFEPRTVRSEVRRRNRLATAPPHFLLKKTIPPVSLSLFFFFRHTCKVPMYVPESSSTVQRLTRYAHHEQTRLHKIHTLRLMYAHCRKTLDWRFMSEHPIEKRSRKQEQKKCVCSGKAR